MKLITLLSGVIACVLMLSIVAQNYTTTMAQDIRLMVLDYAFPGNSRALNTLVRQWGITPALATKIVKSFVSSVRSSSRTSIAQCFKTAKKHTELVKYLLYALEQYKCTSALEIALEKQDFRYAKRLIATLPYTDSSYWKELLGVREDIVTQALASVSFNRLTYTTKKELKERIAGTLDQLEQARALLGRQKTNYQNTHTRISSLWLAAFVGTVLVLVGARLVDLMVDVPSGSRVCFILFGSLLGIESIKLTSHLNSSAGGVMAHYSELIELIDRAVQQLTRVDALLVKSLYG